MKIGYQDRRTKYIFIPATFAVLIGLRVIASTTWLGVLLILCGAIPALAWGLHVRRTYSKESSN